MPVDHCIKEGHPGTSTDKHLIVVRADSLIEPPALRWRASIAVEVIGWLGVTFANAAQGLRELAVLLMEPLK